MAFKELRLRGVASNQAKLEARIVLDALLSPKRKLSRPKPRLWDIGH